MRVRDLALAALPFSFSLLSACGDTEAERQADRVEDQVETQAEASAAAAGTAVAALGLTEAQLLDADLVDATGKDLGDVEQIRRSADRAVESFLVEVEDSDPDRYVLVPLTGLTTRVDGDDTDLQTSMTAADIAAMPDAKIAPM